MKITLELSDNNYEAVELAEDVGDGFFKVSVYDHPKNPRALCAMTLTRKEMARLAEAINIIVSMAKSK